MRFSLLAFTIFALISFSGLSLNAIELANALQDELAEREPANSWNDFDFSPKVWTIDGTATERKQQIKAEVLSLDGAALLLKEVTKGGISRVKTTSLSADEQRYLAAC